MKLLKKNNILFLSVLALNFAVFSNVSYIYASEEGEEENTVSPSSLERRSFSSEKAPLSVVNENFSNLPKEKSEKAYDKVYDMKNAPKSEEIAQEHQALRLNGGFLAEELKPLLDESYKAIYLNSVYEGIDIKGYFCQQHYLKISPEIINPKVEILSLHMCGLKDKHIKRINELGSLRRLSLDANSITDEGVKSIAQLEKLEFLSLAANKISNASLPQLFGMPNLTSLDISGNENISDKGIKIIFIKNKLRSLKISFTGITRKMHKEIKEKCENLELS